MRNLFAFVTFELSRQQIRVIRSAKHLRATMKKAPPLDIRTLRSQVEGLGTTLCWQGNQWIAHGRHTEPLGHSIKTERDALEFVLDRAKERTRNVAKPTSSFLGDGDGDHGIRSKQVSDQTVS